MGKFTDWLLGREPEPAAVEEKQYAPAAQEEHGLYVGPPITQAQAAQIQATLESAESVDPFPEFEDEYGNSYEEEDTVQPDDLVPGWKRKGRPYVHFRTVKIVDRDDGFKFKVRGRSGKFRFKSELYTLKSNAKRAAIAWVKKSAIPTKFVDDQYDGQVVYDTNAQDA